jgi:hypothetical protein
MSWAGSGEQAHSRHQTSAVNKNIRRAMTMKLTIQSIDGKGDLSQEAITLNVLGDTNMKHWLVAETTCTDGTHITNDVGPVFWKPEGRALKTGDTVIIRTRDDFDDVTVSSGGTTIHTLFWGLDHPIWTRRSDCAVLFSLDGWGAASAFPSLAG